jgi:hypothetical protein
MSREIKDLFATNWEDELQDDEVLARNEDGESINVVLLSGLQRLARQAGLIRQRVELRTPKDTMVQAIFTNVFHIPAEGEVEFVGTADCTKHNTQGKYLNYPTAVAESRAEARSLRKALGISMLSSEEVGLREGVGALEASPQAKVSSSMVAAIEKLCEDRNIEPVSALNAVLDDERASTIFELSELRTDEAQDIMAWLNEQKPKATKSKRSARKAELEAKQNAS